LNADMQAKVGRLYFAGEATDEEANGYVQGAYNSGKNVAKMAIDDLKYEDEGDAEVANGEEEEDEEEEEEEKENSVQSRAESMRAGGTADLDEELDAELIGTVH
jgi:hypothetical protein